jgi:predicted ATPase/DNA-binding SARP family transcriptional activator
LDVGEAKVRVDIYLLGGFQVLVDGAPVPDEAWRRRDAAALVKLLALSRGHRMPREQVLDALWPELLVDQGAPRLHKAAHFARTALGHRDGVVLSRDAVALFPAAEIVVDVERLDEAAAGFVPDQAAEAVEQYRGDLLPDDLYEPWTEDPREQLRLRYVELLRALGRWDQLLAADPVDEEAHLHLVREHARQGERSAALRQLDRMETVLQEELGAGMSAAAAALREEVLAMPPDVSWERRVTRHAPVPRPTTPTIGRTRDVQAVVAMIREAAIVTLLGPGGVGKTRLALEVALAEDANVDACFVDLTKVSEPGLVPGLIARELGLHVESTSRVEQVLEEALRGRSLLLVLDNFEHVVDAAPIVGRLAHLSPGIRVLSTSRARLHVSGERVFDVAPLALEPALLAAGADARPGDAVALFEQAATAVDPQFRLPSHFDDVLRICRTVDGLPLAIELAAGHVRTLPPPLLRARLGARLGSPTGTARDAPPRQQTIPATIDWSLKLLGEAEQELFARLGVFAGAVPLSAIEEVCSAEGGDVVDALSRLVDHSLVRRTTGPGGEPRFLLLELLRERARELLAERDEAAVRDRHAAYAAAFVEDVDERRWTDLADRWLDVFAESLAEIGAAHDWAQQRGDVEVAARIAAGLVGYWHREGHHVEGRRWVSAALDQADGLDDDLRARLHLAAGFVEWPRDLLVAREHLYQAIAAFRALGDNRRLSYALALASVTHIGDPESHELALALADESIELARHIGERTLLAQALNVKGEIARVHGDDEMARNAYEEGRDLAASAHDESHLAMFLGNLGFLADHRGDYAEARRLTQEALRLCWALNRRMLAAWMLAELAGPEVGLGRPELGARLLGASDQALSVLGVNRHPSDMSEYERVVAGLCELLGEDDYERFHSDGARLSLDEAVGVALAGASDRDVDGPPH